MSSDPRQSVTRWAEEYAGLLEAPPHEVMSRLRDTLDFKRQPQVILHAIQSRD